MKKQYRIPYRKIIILIVGVLLLIALFYSRFAGLDWGLPYPMHPDERNMVIAMFNMNCQGFSPFRCASPKFYAYGQLPMYFGYIIAQIFQIAAQTTEITIQQYTLAIRTISAIASSLSVITLYKTFQKFSKHSLTLSIASILILIFSPGAIQFAHFGTTESLLMLFVSLIIYLSIGFIYDKISRSKYILFTGIILGLALSTKVSSVLFATVPLITFIVYGISEKTSSTFISNLFSLIKIGAISGVFFIIGSPYNIIDWPGFVHSMNYESSVGLGTYKAFYTRQFEYTVPVIFQFIKIYPFTLGVPTTVIFFLGFILLPFKKRNIILWLSFFVLFLTSGFMYSKWSRFYAQTFPIMQLLVISVLMIFDKIPLRTLRITALIVITLVIITPGVAYLNIYQSEDVRFIASKWMYENIDKNSVILAETANVVDVPMPSALVSEEKAMSKSLHPISFNSYDVDNDPRLERELTENIDVAQYIFVPSRRVFWNHTCWVSDLKSNVKYYNYSSILSGYETARCDKLGNTYPVLQTYYNKLIGGSLGFKQVAVFHVYPKIELFGKTLIEFPDESAEETWTVFDHPVVRIYKKV
ncbi:hypothetical protein COV58_01030 [Candidatus Roizmanbacteria bacterium CG11_big_fil_rev_8_21_14_0_20_36_8]|uniref:Uncharacterized protein n=2 Tax=Candidatus Roizmaniibacteriota TaxID=1752723 RepID=A0A2M6IUY7_9BACT|nr:MAG: hypothetical protein COV58_01030 [Candidatus Roizmanbacteria bacterium CG11_big_fil_rev_8_21_14_0_20_36_8]PIZ65908.1 MAG: hypothetical protein COY14_01410 [Candidatus Roizmanbacteria bacterium CG_4_10_14_0_2_um_filter_36_9]